MYENITANDITLENALLFVKFNPKKTVEIAEILVKKGHSEIITDVFKLSPSGALQFTYSHPEYAADLATLIPNKIDEIINIIDLPKEQLVRLAVLFPEKVLPITRINSDSIPKIFYESMHNAGNEKADKIAKNKYEMIQKNIAKIGKEFPDKIIPILKQINEFRNKCNEAEDIIISTAKFFPQNAAEIALAYSLELKIAIEVPSIAAKIAIQKPELAFEIIKDIPQSESEIKEHFTIKNN